MTFFLPHGDLSRGDLRRYQELGSLFLIKVFKINQLRIYEDLHRVIEKEILTGWRRINWGRHIVSSSPSYLVL